MENFNQIESDILNKIKNVSDRNSYEMVKTEIFGKKGIITELFKKVGSLDQNKRKEYASKLNSLKTKNLIDEKYISVGKKMINNKIKNSFLIWQLINLNLFFENTALQNKLINDKR